MSWKTRLQKYIDGVQSVVDTYAPDTPQDLHDAYASLIPHFREAIEDMGSNYDTMTAAAVASWGRVVDDMLLLHDAALQARQDVVAGGDSSLSALMDSAVDLAANGLTLAGIMADAQADVVGALGDSLSVYAGLLADGVGAVVAAHMDGIDAFYGVFSWFDGYTVEPDNNDIFLVPTSPAGASSIIAPAGASVGVASRYPVPSLRSPVSSPVVVLPLPEDKRRMIDIGECVMFHHYFNVRDDYDAYAHFCCAYQIETWQSINGGKSVSYNKVFAGCTDFFNKIVGLPVYNEFSLASADNFPVLRPLVGSHLGLSEYVDFGLSAIGLRCRPTYMYPAFLLLENLVGNGWEDVYCRTETTSYGWRMYKSDGSILQEWSGSKIPRYDSFDGYSRWPLFVTSEGFRVEGKTVLVTPVLRGVDLTFFKEEKKVALAPSWVFASPVFVGCYNVNRC